MEEQHYKCPVQVNREKAQEHKAAEHFFSIQVMLVAEMSWVIKMVMQHNLFNSSSDMSVIVSQIFPDSEIIKRFSCGGTKLAYFECFGLKSIFQGAADLRRVYGTHSSR